MSEDKRKGKKTFEFKGFINYYLTEDEMRFVKSQTLTEAEVCNQICKLTDSGYKLTFNFDEYNECYQATLTAVSSGNRNCGYAISGRGSDPIKAMKQLMYIHFQVCEEEWGVIQEKAQRWKNIDD